MVMFGDQAIRVDSSPKGLENLMEQESFLRIRHKPNYIKNVQN
jgi:hypothetical protein